MLFAADDDGGLQRLLVQRALQTCCYNLRVCRDPPTAKWLAEHWIVDETYHGLDGLLGEPAEDWHEWILSLLSSPPVDVEVTSILKKHRGISSNNPFLQPTPMTYSYELKPSEVAERMLSTIQLISEEWLEDLALMDAEGEGVWRSRRAVTLDTDEEVRETLPAFNIDQVYGTDSPFRGGSYELLVALATRQAAQSALASLSAQQSGWAARDLLEDHCKEEGLFAGELPPTKRAAENWIAALLEKPVALRIGKSEEAEPALVDPRGVVEQVLEWRSAVAADWIRRLEAIPDELLEIKREHLSRSTAGVAEGAEDT